MFPEYADAVTQDFRNGELAMYVSSSVAAKKNTEAGINWDYVPYLTDEQGGTFVANDSLVMLSSCENKEAAASLMKELTSATMMQDFHGEPLQHAADHERGDLCG